MISAADAQSMHHSRVLQSPWQRLALVWQYLQEAPEAKRALQVLQALSSLLFVVLYVWSTYSSPAPHSLRANADLALCTVFAVEWMARFAVSSRAPPCRVLQ